MPRLETTVLFCLLVIAAVATVASGEFYGSKNLYGKIHKKEEAHDPCEHFVCTTGKDGRRTFCRVACVCDIIDGDTSNPVCNFTLPVCVNRANEDTYYDYQPEKSVCKIGNPLITLSTGDSKLCKPNGGDNETCPMGYDCIDPDTGKPATDMGVCCLSTAEMEEFPTCPKVQVKFEPYKNPHQRKSKRRDGYGSDIFKYKYNVCMNKCYSNYDCYYGEICCHTGCGYKCIKPETTTTSTTTTTTTTMPTTEVTSTTEMTTSEANLPLVLGSSTRSGSGSLAGVSEITTPPPPTSMPHRGPVYTNSRCPIDPYQVVCGQIFCNSDKDCDQKKGEVCCGSKTCNQKYNQGTVCMKLPRKKVLHKKKPFFGTPLHLNKPSFGFQPFGGSAFGPSSKQSQPSYFPSLYDSPASAPAFGSAPSFSYDKPPFKPGYQDLPSKYDSDPRGFGVPGKFDALPRKHRNLGKPQIPHSKGYDAHNMEYDNAHSMDGYDNGPGGMDRYDEGYGSNEGPHGGSSSMYGKDAGFFLKK